MKTRRLSKSLAILLALVMIMAAIPMSAVATSVPDHDRISVGSGEYATLVWDSNDYMKGTITTLDSSYYPQKMLFYADDGTISSSVSPVWIGSVGAYEITLPGTAGSFTVTLNDPATGTGVYTIYYSAPYGTKPTPAASIYAFLPAPGQFTNEGVTIGGWGDAYDSTGNLKVNNSTGVSLGFFGGYVVYKFDDPVLNTATNPYGADFIVYGNAFWNNSEPGCIQVSQDGTTWYDIAGYLFYNSATIRNASITYTNPNVTQDAGITAAGNNLGTRADISYSLNGTTGTVSTNTFHNHSWWPLNANYFVGRNSNPALDKVSVLPFASRTTSNGVSGTLTFTGVELAGITATNQTTSMGFGYCDVHPNVTLGGTVAYNPYALPNSAVNSANAYNAFLTTAGVNNTQASGGDPIDISWAVYPAGTTIGGVDVSYQPKELGSIQYVRIYTGPAKLTPPFGEISTEVLGCAAVSSASGAGAAQYIPTIKYGTTPVSMPNTISHSYMTQTPISVSAGTYYISATESHTDNIYINGNRVNSGTGVAVTLTSGTTKYVQIITQDDTNSPYVTLIKFTCS